MKATSLRDLWKSKGIKVFRKEDKHGDYTFKHNQEAYRAVQTLLAKESRAAVVHPTGTGKSMVAFI